jgi:hypothetical protein
VGEGKGEAIRVGKSLCLSIDTNVKTAGFDRSTDPGPTMTDLKNIPTTELLIRAAEAAQSDSSCEAEER